MEDYGKAEVYRARDLLPKCSPKLPHIDSLIRTFESLVCDYVRSPCEETMDRLNESKSRILDAIARAQSIHESLGGLESSLRDFKL